MIKQEYGYVYFLRSKNAIIDEYISDSGCKIGISINPLERQKQLSGTNNLVYYECAKLIKSTQYKELEKRLHNTYKDIRVWLDKKDKKSPTEYFDYKSQFKTFDKFLLHLNPVLEELKKEIDFEEISPDDVTLESINKINKARGKNKDITEEEELKITQETFLNEIKNNNIEHFLKKYNDFLLNNFKRVKQTYYTPFNLVDDIIKDLDLYKKKILILNLEFGVELNKFTGSNYIYLVLDDIVKKQVAIELGFKQENIYLIDNYNNFDKLDILSIFKINNMKFDFILSNPPYNCEGLKAKAKHGFLQILPRTRKKISQ